MSKDKGHTIIKPLNPVKVFLKGMPCAYGDVVCRMIGVHPFEGHYENIEGNLVHTNIIISTPHGTGLNPTREYITEVNKAQQEYLLTLESDIKSEGGELYGGFLKESEFLNVEF